MDIDTIAKWRPSFVSQTDGTRGTAASIESRGLCVSARCLCRPKNQEPKNNQSSIVFTMVPLRVIASLFFLLGYTLEGDGFQIIRPISERSLFRTHPQQQHVSPTTTLYMARQARRRPPPVKENKPVMNEGIQSPELRVIASGAAGKDESFGIMTREDALLKAKELGDLDLILINDKSDPPVCKIVDYSKYRYSQTKKAKEIRKNSKATEIKEVKMSYKIDVHDYEVRKKNADKFLRQGNRVKCTVVFRGREVQHDNLGYDLLDKLGADLTETALREGRPKREGRNLAVILSPRPEVMKAVSDERRAEDRAKKLKKKEQLEMRASSKASLNEDAEVTDEDMDDDDDIDDEDMDDDDDDDDDDDEDMEDSLDALLGGNDSVTKDLFS